jgi:hypothetical protein
MGWNDHLDPFDEAEAFEDEYFDGEDLSEDLLYHLYDESEYDYEIFEDTEEDQL